MASADLVPSILRWRERALDNVLWAVLGIGLAPLVYVFIIRPGTVSPGLGLFGAGIYLALVALTAGRRLPHRLRCWGALLVVYAFAGGLLVVRGVEGTGRLLLVALPIHATVLLGAPAGWVAAGTSVALYAATATFHVTGFPGWAFPEGGDRLEQPVWAFQGVMLLVVLAPVMVLVIRFIGTLQGVLAAEIESDRERRRLQKVLLHTGERERRTIGHQLHDGPCQQVTAALVRCKVVQNTLCAREAREEIAHLEAIAGMLDAAVGEIHELARGLSPPGPAAGPLTAALAALAQGVRQSGIACDCCWDGAEPLDEPAVAAQLLRIAQEAVRNATRHARPRRIRIELARDEGWLTLRVQDDGIGMPAEIGGDGMGISIMRYRAELMGGSLTVGPAPDGGTSVSCTLPLAPSETALGVPA